MRRTAYRKFRRTYKRKYKKSLAAKVAKIQRTLTIRKPENKWAESNNNVASFNYSGALAQPMGISQGSADFGNRIGDEITLTSFTLKMIFTMSGTTFGQTNRVVVAQLKNNPDGGSISSASYLNLIMHSADIGTARATMATLDKDNKGWFRILADKVFTMNYSSSPGTSASNNYQIKYLKVPVKLPQAARTVQFYNGTSSITKNEIVIMVFSDTSTSQTFSSVIRIGYYDP